MLSSYPIQFNSTQIIKPSKYTENYEVVEAVNQSEAGTDIVAVTRTGKLSISLEYKCTSFWLKKFVNYADEDTIEVKKYAATESGYETYTMRMRKLKVNFEENSENVATSDGLWTVTFTLEEI